MTDPYAYGFMIIYFVEKWYPRVTRVKRRGPHVERSSAPFSRRWKLLFLSRHERRNGFYSRRPSRW